MIGEGGQKLPVGGNFRFQVRVTRDIDRTDFFKLVGSAASVYLLVDNYRDYSTSFTITNIDSTTASLQQIIFPSIFICNVNQVSKSFLGKATHKWRHALRGIVVLVVIFMCFPVLSAL